MSVKTPGGYSQGQSQAFWEQGKSLSITQLQPLAIFSEERSHGSELLKPWDPEIYSPQDAA